MQLNVSGAPGDSQKLRQYSQTSATPVALLDISWFHSTQSSATLVALTDINHVSSTNRHQLCW